MNSKVTVEVAFDLPGNPPIIQIIARESTDTRDQICQAFIRKLGQRSSFCKVHTASEYDKGPQAAHFKRIIIEPLGDDDLEKTIIDILEAISLTHGTQRAAGFGNKMDLYTPAERAIHIAIQEIEKMGAHKLLTDAQNLLSKAQENIDKYVTIK